MSIAQLGLSLVVFASAVSLAMAAQAQGGDGSAFNWTGPYFGINAGDVIKGGTIFDQTTGELPNNTSALQLGLRPVAHAVNKTGFAGGAQIGYNAEIGDMPGLGALGFGGGLVMGFEADADYTDVRRTDTLSNTTNYGPLDTPGAAPTTRVNQYQGELRYLSTLRGRLGLAYRNVLLYGTGGAAFGEVRRHLTFYGPNATTEPYFFGANDSTKWGYAYGGGIEFAAPTHTFLSRFNLFHSSGATLKLEYIHYNLGADNLVAYGVNGGAGLGSYTARVRTEGDLVRAGLNYKF